MMKLIDTLLGTYADIANSYRELLGFCFAQLQLSRLQLAHILLLNQNGGINTLT